MLLVILIPGLIRNLPCILENICDFYFDCVAGVCTPLSVPECQAVGRSSTMFPNLFGHTTLEDTHQVFAAFKRDVFCSQNAMYYLCSLVYPVCNEGVRIDPCQSYCDGKSWLDWWHVKRFLIWNICVGTLCRFKFALFYL